MPKFAPTTTDMNDVFKQHPKPDIMKDLIETYRAKARQTLQETMPTSIIRLQALIAQESDPSSPFWIGQLDNGAYLPENLKLYQPGQVVPQGTGLKEVVNAGDIKGAVIDQSPIDLGGIKEVIAEIQPGISQSKEEVDQGVERESNTPNSLVGVDMKQKVGAHYFEISPRNANQEQVIKIVRAEAESLMFALSDLRVWLSLETPIIEDGNSFGADVQSHLSTEIDKSFNKAAGYMNGCKRHFDDRAQAVKNWVYMPNVADYPAAIAGSDRIDHVLARGYLRNMLVIYGGLMSKLEKNWGKVISPKGSGGGGDAMY